jgi:hypothetical protein
VTQRWVREFTARKRLFSTKDGHVGIGWEAVRPGDEVVLFAGLRSPLVVRKQTDHVEPGHLYRLIGPCNIPHLAAQELKRANKTKAERFTII